MLKNKLLTIASLTGAVAFLPLAHADEFLDKRWYIAPFGSYLNSENRTGITDDNWGVGLGIGKILNRHFNAEVRGFYQEFDNISGTKNDAKLAGGTLDLQYFFLRDKFSPYVVAAIGGMNTDSRRGSFNKGSLDSGSYSKPSFIFETGLGATYEITDNFLLRADARYRLDTLAGEVTKNDAVFNDVVVNVGFVIPFGKKPKSAIEPETPVAAAPIADCSTLDADSDGVNDCLDQCPGTIKDTRIDNSGCPVRLVLKGQHFNYDSAELTLNAKKLLDGVAESLIAYPQKNDIEVQGHASSEGADDYNMRLSQRRSESVVEYLKAKGVTNKLLARGFGESLPVADNSTEAGRSENRRVELIWIEN